MESSNYYYSNPEPACTHAYLAPALNRIIAAFAPEGSRIFDLGCGNGAFGAHLHRRGYDVTGVDASEEGIRQGNHAYPQLKLFQASAYDDLASRFGRFPVVVSLEVVEHVYQPRLFARRVFELAEPGGVAVISTPYHGYWKNLFLALSGKLERHFTVLWDNGHIKFWSIATLAILLNEAGFDDIRFERIGRLPPIAKSMIAVARRSK